MNGVTSIILCAFVAAFCFSECFSDGPGKSESRIEQIEQAVEMLQVKLKKCKDEQVQLKSKLVNHTEEIGLLMSELQLIDTLEKPTNSQLQYGFTAWKNSAESYTVGDVIIFENVLSNIGNAYDPLTGYFTCPTTGFYLVILSLQRSSYNHLVVEVVLEGNRIFFLDDKDVDHGYNHASTTGLFNCIADRRIWVRAYASGSVNGGAPTSLFTILGL